MCVLFHVYVCVCVCKYVCIFLKYVSVCYPRTHLSVPIIKVVHVAPPTERVLFSVVVLVCRKDGDTRLSRHLTRLPHDINCQSLQLPSLLVSDNVIG